MARGLQGSVLLAAALLASACSVVNSPGGDGTSAGGQGGAGQGGTDTGGTGAVGGGPQCGAPSECPGVDSQCRLRTCEQGQCGFEDLGVGTPCTEGGGTVCDGLGHCVVGGDGNPCTSPNECGSGFCADGVCCGSACDADCVACNLDGSEGICGPVPAGQDPASDCQPPASCDGAGSCKRPDGTGCSDGLECSSGFCVDGVCCGSACTGACERCDVASPAGTCAPVGAGDPGSPSCSPYVCSGSSGSCPLSCADADGCAGGYSCDPNGQCQLSYPNGMGGTYAATGLTERDNALLACESYWGLGLCCSDGCGSCNDLGYHRCGTPNCNGSTYWNFANDQQTMGCGWMDPNEILICLDGKTWQQ